MWKMRHRQPSFSVPEKLGDADFHVLAHKQQLCVLDLKVYVRDSHFKAVGNSTLNDFLCEQGWDSALSVCVWGLSLSAWAFKPSSLACGSLFGCTLCV